MKNQLLDLNNHLFAQLERLGKEELCGEPLRDEIERTKAITSAASQIISNASLVLDAHKAFGDGLIKSIPGAFSLDGPGALLPEGTKK